MPSLKWDSVPRDTVAFKPTNASPTLRDMTLGIFTHLENSVFFNQMISYLYELGDQLLNFLAPKTAFIDPNLMKLWLLEKNKKI